jgi:hypothetical protein
VEGGATAVVEVLTFAIAIESLLAPLQRRASRELRLTFQHHNIEALTHTRFLAEKKSFLFRRSEEIT